ncbi:hypothetical protein [Pseudoalteromonas rubra]|uniref:hypothetical protein n=1 Tax=Pseudoalteromonas rubra TaxID=43658 RepID=UPI002DBDA9A6|nr:hypothetical protein [Pseudoalteromonas rubra]MEC4091153.1 hypothetical protein [Pseudoalteromonas rubra]
MVKYLPWALAAGAAWWLHSKISAGSDIIAKPIGSALAEAQMWLNGSHGISRDWPGFYLDSTKLDHNYTVADPVWYKAISELNEANEKLLNEIFDASKTLKPQYRVLLDNEVSPETIATVIKG